MFVYVCELVCRCMFVSVCVLWVCCFSVLEVVVSSEYCTVKELCE